MDWGEARAGFKLRKEGGVGEQEGEEGVYALFWVELGGRVGGVVVVGGGGASSVVVCGVRKGQEKRKGVSGGLD